MNLLQINELESILALWEDINLYTSFLSRMAQIKQEGKLKHFKINYEEIKGTELNSNGILFQPIKDYSRFRQFLEKGLTEIDSELFLPNTPLVMRKVYSKIGLLSVEFAKPILAVPFFISAWLEHKSVVTLGKDVTLSEVPIQNADTNYLPYLPYEAFLVSLPEPISLGTTVRSITFSKFICLLTDNLNDNERGIVHVFCIADNPEKFQLTQNERHKLKEFLAYKKGRFSQRMTYEIGLITKTSDKINSIYFDSCLDFSFLADNGKLLLMNEGYVVESLNPFVPTSVLSEKGVNVVSGVYRKIVSLINSLGKMFFETNFGYIDPTELRELVNQEDLSISLTENNTLLESGNKSLTITESTELKWNEVSGEHVCHIKTRKIKGKQVAVMVSGSEKNPHVRRGHPHHYRKSDGTLVKKWLKPIILRKDKLKEVKIKGTPLSIKI